MLHRTTAITALAMCWLLPRLVNAATRIRLDVGETGPEQVGTALKMVALLTVLSLAPAILMTMTSFVRIVVVFSFIRMALGTQNAPPQQILVGLALFLSAAIMAPVGQEFYQTGVKPYLDGTINGAAAYAAASIPLRRFMLRQTRDADLELFYEINQTEYPTVPADVGMHLLVPAFVLSELRTAFEMGFMIFVPFMLLDIIVASVTMALGLVMMPPALLSLPLKVMVFVMADGWSLLVGSLVRSFT